MEVEEDGVATAVVVIVAAAAEVDGRLRWISVEVDASSSSEDVSGDSKRIRKKERVIIKCIKLIFMHVSCASEKKNSLVFGN